MCRHGEGQKDDGGPEVAGRRKHGQPRHAAPRQYHADAEGKPANHQRGNRQVR